MSEEKPAKAKTVRAPKAPQTQLALPERAALALGSAKTEADLVALVKQSADIVAVIDKDGREQCHRMAMNLRTARTTIEGVAKAAREDATKFSKAVIAEENRLLAITADEEARIFKLRDDFDAVLAAEKAEKARIEAERVGAIQDRIQALRELPFTMMHKPSADIETALTGLIETAITEDLFGDGLYFGIATAAKSDSVRALQTAHAAAIAQEELAAEVAKQAEANRIAAAILKEQQETLAREVQAAADERRAAELRAEAEAAATKKASKEAAEKIAEQQAELDLRIKRQNELDEQRRKAEQQEVDEKAERERLAALPPEPAPDIAPIEKSPCAAVADLPMSIQAPAAGPAMQLSMLDAAIPHHDHEESADIIAFRLAANTLLDVLSADDVINLLAEIIDVRLASEVEAG